MPKPDHRCALFRLEGTLCTRPTLTAAAWMSLNARRVRARLLGLSSFALAGPLARLDPNRATRLALSSLESMSEDRLIVLGEIYAEEHLLDALNPVGLELLERCRAAGQRIVLLSDNLDVIVGPLARHLGIDDFIANSMALDERRRATGQLRAPILGQEIGGPALAHHLGELDLGLDGAAGYGTHRGDAVLLSAVTLPCAVTPDRELRRIARDLDWPVVEA